MKEQVSRHLRILSYAIVLIIIFQDLQNTYRDTGNVIETVILTVFLALGLLLTLWFAHLCTDMARKINKSLSWAYAIGFFIGAIGLIGYWIYYKSQLRNKSTVKTPHR